MRSAAFRLFAVPVRRGLGRLIEHLRLLIRLLFATDVGDESDGEEAESGRLFHILGKEVVVRLISLPRWGMQPECPPEHSVSARLR